MIFDEYEIEYIKSNYKTMSYKQMTENINLFNKIKKTEKQVRRKAEHLNLYKYDRGLKKNFFENIDNEINAYWVGFLYADGWIQGDHEIQIELQRKDIQHIERFKKDINQQSKIKTYEKDILIANNKNIQHTETCKIRVYQKQMFDDLYKIGFRKDKTYNSIFPIIEDDKLFIHMLRGFIDGDGCIYIDKNGRTNLHITNNNIFFLEHIKNRMDAMGFKTQIYKETETKNRLVWTSKVLQFLDVLYKDSTIYLERKYNKYITGRDNQK